MARRKIAEDKALKHLIRARVDDATYARLNELKAKSDARSLCAVVRQLITGEQITVLHKDISMSGPLEELALVRKELKAIGVNINQQTHAFHASQTVSAKAWYVERTAKLYSEVGAKIDELLALTEKLALKWLPVS